MVKIEVTYKGKTYTFKYGSEAYIFHTGIFNDIDALYGEDTLLEYTELVHYCYMKDSNRTPLGQLADYIAEHWLEVKEKDKYDILDDFYFNTDFI